MTTMIAELYDALIAAGSPEDDVSEVKERISRLERDAFLMKWMLGFVLAFQIAIFIKLFLH